MNLNQVSIILNVHNGAQYIAGAIHSVMAQDYNDWELIIWDNASHDNTKSIVKSFNDPRIRYFRSEQFTTLGRARELAWAKVQGQYVCILDCDDYYEKTKIATQVKQFKKSKDSVICISNVKFFSNRRSVSFYSEPPKSGDVVRDLISSYFVVLPTVMIDRSLFPLHFEAFRSKYSHIADFDLIARVATLGKLTYVDEVLCGWRVHANSESWRKRYLFSKELIEWSTDESVTATFSSYRTDLRGLFVRNYVYFYIYKTINKNLSSHLSLDYVPVRLTLVEIFIFYPYYALRFLASFIKNILYMKFFW